MINFKGIILCFLVVGNLFTTSFGAEQPQHHIDPVPSNEAITTQSLSDQANDTIVEMTPANTYGTFPMGQLEQVEPQEDRYSCKNQWITNMTELKDFFCCAKNEHEDRYSFRGQCCENINSLMCCAAVSSVWVGIVLLESSPVILSSWSNESEGYALCSAFMNSFILFASTCLKSDNRDHALGTAFFYAIATATAWLYWSQWHNDQPLNDGLRFANILCTSIILASNFLRGC